MRTRTIARLLFASTLASCAFDPGTEADFAAESECTTEAEPNDTWELARSRPTCPSMAGTIASAQGGERPDVDVYWFVTQTGNVHVDLTFDESAVDLDLHLYAVRKYDAQGGISEVRQVRYSMSPDHDEAIDVSFVGTPEASPWTDEWEYFVEVTGYAGSEGDYTLVAADLPAGPPSKPELAACARDVFDRVAAAPGVAGNDGDRVATRVGPPGAPEMLSICPADQDWIRVEVPAGRAVAVDIDFTHTLGDLDMALFHAVRDASGRRTWIGDSHSRTDRETLVLPWSAAEDDDGDGDADYLILVYGMHDEVDLEGRTVKKRGRAVNTYWLSVTELEAMAGD